MAFAAVGALRLDIDGYAVPSVKFTVNPSVLYVVWRRLRMPVAMWGAGFWARSPG